MKIFSLLILSNLFVTQAFSHGEDKYGPNKGYIRMPGTFHTEVVPEKDGSYRVYLLDVQNKNPKVQDSSVALELKTSNKSINFVCAAQNETYFHCKSDEVKKESKEGQIILKTKRNAIAAKEAIYNLPLKLEFPNKSKEANSQSHDMHNMKH